MKCLLLPLQQLMLKKRPYSSESPSQKVLTRKHDYRVSSSTKKEKSNGERIERFKIILQMPSTRDRKYDSCHNWFHDIETDSLMCDLDCAWFCDKC